MEAKITATVAPPEGEKAAGAVKEKKKTWRVPLEYIKRLEANPPRWVPFQPWRPLADGERPSQALLDMRAGGDEVRARIRFLHDRDVDILRQYREKGYAEVEEEEVDEEELRALEQS